jgi:hypothetical protein
MLFKEIICLLWVLYETHVYTLKKLCLPVLSSILYKLPGKDENLTAGIFSVCLLKK